MEIQWHFHAAGVFLGSQIYWKSKQQEHANFETKPK